MRWSWVWVGSGSWWWTGKPGVLQSMGSQRVGHDWVTELNFPHTFIIFWSIVDTFIFLCVQFDALEHKQISVIPWYHLVQFSCSVMSDSLQPHGLQHTRLPCPSPTPGAYSNSCPWSPWCHPTISSSVVPFSSRLQSFPASGILVPTKLGLKGSSNQNNRASEFPLEECSMPFSRSRVPIDGTPEGWTSWGN